MRGEIHLLGTTPALSPERDTRGTPVPDVVTGELQKVLETSSVR